MTGLMDLAYREEEAEGLKATLINYQDPDEVLNLHKAEDVVEHGWWKSRESEEYAVAWEEEMEPLECRDEIARLLPAWLVFSVDGETDTYVLQQDITMDDSQARGKSNPVAILHVDGVV